MLSLDEKKESEMPPSIANGIFAYIRMQEISASELLNNIR
jgi:hypothetical protein